jgi:uncharacterized phiE125 gp8 family phage protein
MTDYSPYFGGRGYPLPWFSQFLHQRNLRIITPAAEEQISLTTAQEHLRLDVYGSPLGHPDDGILQNVYIPIARAVCESISGRAFVPQTYELGLGQFPCTYVAFDRNGIKLGMGPVRGVTSVIYNDGTQDVTLDGSAYVVDPYTDGGFIYPAYGTSWPVAAQRPNAVRVRFTAGYDVAGASPYEFPLPNEYLWAMLLALGHVYENRENTTTLNLAEIPMGIRSLLGPSSLINGFA